MINSSYISKNIYSNANLIRKNKHVNRTVNKTAVNTMKFFAGMSFVQSDLLKSIGKAAISPLFIIFNPFVKEDKESRNYSAVMQPIEAGCNFLSYLAINMAAGAGLSYLAKKNKFGTALNPIKNPENFKKFQSTAFIGTTFLAIPLVSKLLSNVTPKIVKILEPKKSNKKEAISYVC